MSMVLRSHLAPMPGPRQSMCVLEPQGAAVAGLRPCCMGVPGRVLTVAPAFAAGCSAGLAASVSLAQRHRLQLTRKLPHHSELSCSATEQGQGDSGGFGKPAVEPEDPQAARALTDAGSDVELEGPALVGRAAVVDARGEPAEAEVGKAKGINTAASPAQAPAPAADEKAQQEAPERPPPRTQQSRRDPYSAALVAQQLTHAGESLCRWGYVAEVSYTWLGVVSLVVATFSAFAGSAVHGGPNLSTALGLPSVGLSLLCGLVGWFQARTCRSVGRRCGLASRSFEAGGPMPPATLMTGVPSLAEIEGQIRARQRTALLGTFFAVLGLQAMVGLLVAKVFAAAGTLNPAPGVSLDVFTLLAVCNSALSHVISGGAAACQQGALPPPSTAYNDRFRGWGA
mmetsp:Transcript_125368/g.401484  ORF Transcript_125368/g.401484 Transcript_125368/m.401484 type:complete len:398 (-) Transcript_125368:16-1209(-)